MQWTVMRMDDSGNQYPVAKNLPLMQAEKLQEEYEAKAHKQIYWLKLSSPQEKILVAE